MAQTESNQVRPGLLATMTTTISTTQTMTMTTTTTQTMTMTTMTTTDTTMTELGEDVNV